MRAAGTGKLGLGAPCPRGGLRDGTGLLEQRPEPAGRPGSPHQPGRVNRPALRSYGRSQASSPWGPAGCSPRRPLPARGGPARSGPRRHPAAFETRPVRNGGEAVRERRVPRSRYGGAERGWPALCPGTAEPPLPAALDSPPAGAAHRTGHAARVINKRKVFPGCAACLWSLHREPRQAPVGF